MLRDPYEPLHVGEAEQLTLESAIANLKGEDLGLRFYAAWWLGRFRVRDAEAVDLTIAALTDEDDRTEDGGYPLRRNAARALGKMGDRRAIPDLIACLSCSDYYVREAAVQSLELLGEADCIAPLAQLLEGGIEAAQFVPGKPHLVQPYDAVLEALGSLNAVGEVDRIREFLAHPVERVQYAAARALYQMTGEAQYGDRLIEALAGPELQLRRSALMDLSATDYIPAAPAVAETLAENSLKLIALQGLLENHLGEAGDSLPDSVSEQTAEILMLMDTLL
ncbi:HEAT repeat domain-containing protein [Synechococcus sp. PCC 7336]|uniref:HEAT repeat domain-containing protein n=1 Tax=Synechococcus sp. PCC 7336 TaxID=195250 RepID=UPI00034D8992|nr:HEAT repeat domain-containing protein [Synechococcus sp. PCC 7336]